MNAYSAVSIGGVFAMLMLLRCAGAVTVHVVGDSIGWTVPQQTSAYQTWASSNTFAVGDILTFNFQTDEHDVVEVPKESYDSCTSANATGTVVTTGPTNITLHRTGQHYYICSIGQHCSRGQKLAISVSASPSTGGALPPSTTSPPDATTPTSTPPSPSPSSALVTSAALPFILFSVFMGVAF